MRMVVGSRAGVATAALLLAGAAAWLASTVTAGCSNYERGHVVTKPMDTQEVDRRIQQIQADPHMPQFAKDAAIGQLKRAQGGALAKQK